MPHILTTHVRHRMKTRGICRETVDLVLAFGRIIRTRSAIIHVVGQKEIREHGRFLERCAGVYVLCSPHDGAIITTYRNHDLRGLKSVPCRH